MKALALSSLLTCSVFAEWSSNVIVDWYFSPYMGAEDILSAHRGFQYAQDWMITPPEKPKRGFWSVMGRFTELFFVWDPINSIGIVTQHEFFGHGFRIRAINQSGTEVKGYKIEAPFPYGDGGGATRYKLNERSTTSFENLTIASGGVEATAILANRLKLQWLERGWIDPRESSLYTGSEQDISEYIWFTENKDHEDDGDISYYVHNLNKTYPKGHLSVRSLKRQALVNLVDPFTFYAWFAWWYYLFTGRHGPLPLIPIKPYGYLFNGRLGLTPFGPEYYFENFLVKDEKPIYFYLRGGHFADQNYYGFGVEHAYICEIDGLPYGLKLDCWYQPHSAFRDHRYSMKKLEKEGRFHHQPHHPLVGIALSVTGNVEISKHSSFYFQAGGKTKGYLEGEPLQPSIILRVGMSFR
jgi:hypothetical protein